MYLVLSVGKVPVFVYSILGHFILAGVTKPACDVSRLCLRPTQYLAEYLSQFSHLSLRSNVCRYSGVRGVLVYSRGMKENPKEPRAQ